MVLVDIHFAKEWPKRILVQRKDLEFFIAIEYKELPKFLQEMWVNWTHVIRMQIQCKGC